MKVSVVLPVYNVKAYLERCVRSVLRQTYKDLEIILVDDGSKDGSGEMCDTIATQDRRIRVVHQENKGLSEARNTGIRHATGDFIIFMDSDDEWLLDDGVETMIKHCKADTDLIIFKPVDIWNQEKRAYMPDYDVDTISRLPNAQAVFAYLIQAQRFRASVALLLIRTSVLIDHQILFPSGLISEDVWFDMHLWQHVRKVKILNINFYGYYHRAASITTSPSLRVYNSYDVIFDYWKKQCHQDCVNSSVILSYMADLWVSRGYVVYALKDADKPEAIRILQRHVDLLDHATTPKSIRVAQMLRFLSIRQAVTLLGWYWQLRTFVKR